MNDISRDEFLKISVFSLAAATIPKSLWNMVPDNTIDHELLKLLVKSNDESVSRYWDVVKDDPATMRWYRPLSGAFAAFTASYCHPDSNYFKSTELLKKMEQAIIPLLDLQYPNGLLDSGGNRQSPPDTAFYLESLCPAATVLFQNDFDETARVKEKLKEFLLKAGEGIRNGGVHTPNHRWIVSAMLSQLYSLFPDKKYIDRVDQWLAEGIFINEDGQYPERSRNYSIVVDYSLLTIGRLLNRPYLFEYVKKNLDASYYYMETNGDLITLDSRRQDQNYPIPVTRYYLFYRFLANYYQDEFFAGVAKKIETFEDFDKFVLSRSLVSFMETPLLLNQLPAAQKLPTDYVKLFSQSGLVRIRRGDITASIFGGNDKPLVIASGRSCNPTFFTFRKGTAILEYARLSTSFFNTGYVRSDGVKKNGNTYILQETKEAYYYQPMPAGKRNENGDYPLTESLDGRFWSKMDFPDRPKDTLSLDSTVIIVEEDGSFKMEFQIDGPKDVAVTLEFCFQEGGKLEGVEAGEEKDDYFLENGYAKYSNGNDVIEFGPGAVGHRFVNRIDGEVYSTHFGSIKGSGLHVYVTGFVPFKHSLTIK